MQDIKQQEIKDFSPRDIAIQVMKAIEVADITQWNGKNVFEASEYDAIFQSIEDGVRLAVEQDRKNITEGANNVIWNEDGSLKSHDISTIVNSVMHYLMDLINNK